MRLPRRKALRRTQNNWSSVHDYITNKIAEEGALHFTLIDPDKAYGEALKNVRKLGKFMVEAGTDAFLVGGSVGVSERDADAVVQELKGLGVPVILFPGNITGISRYADAILFLSLLNSDDPYFIIGAQVLGAPIIERYGLETLPTAYIIVGYGGAAGYVGKARPIPYDRPEIGAAYVLAARMMGMKYAYLEAGSGAPEPIPPTFIRYAAKVKKNLTLIVGGGIRSPEKAKAAVRAGADIIVTGTIVEKDPEKCVKIIKSIKRK